jgi:hypothetical protein
MNLNKSNYFIDEEKRIKLRYPTTWKESPGFGGSLVSVNLISDNEEIHENASVVLQYITSPQYG